MAKIPAELYVVAKDQGGVDNVLGFLHSYEPNKASSASKRKTQEDWAYGGYSVAYELENRNGVIYIVGEEWYWVAAARQSIRQPYVKVCEHPPQVWKNVPMRGFKIVKSVSRWSTSNKLWRIMDPRGYQFEITTDCLENIILNSTIVNGTIESECVWVANKKLVVWPLVEE